METRVEVCFSEFLWKNGEANQSFEGDCKLVVIIFGLRSENGVEQIGELGLLLWCGSAE